RGVNDPEHTLHRQQTASDSCGEPYIHTDAPWARKELLRVENSRGERRGGKRIRWNDGPVVFFLVSNGEQQLLVIIWGRERASSQYSRSAPRSSLSPLRQRGCYEIASCEPIRRPSPAKEPGR
ncbi:unnamed protein product, partial [Ectocarpus sp. 12 AP-2014]